jgi:urease accessory protein UreF
MQTAQQNAQQQAAQQRPTSNVPVIHHGMPAQGVHQMVAEKGAQTVTFFSGQQTTIRQGEQTAAAYAYAMFSDLIKNAHRLSPIDQLQRLNALYIYLKKFLKNCDEEDVQAFMKEIAKQSPGLLELMRRLGLVPIEEEPAEKDKNRR